MQNPAIIQANRFSVVGVVAATLQLLLYFEYQVLENQGVSMNESDGASYSFGSLDGGESMGMTCTEAPISVVGVVGKGDCVVRRHAFLYRAVVCPPAGSVLTLFLSCAMFPFVIWISSRQIVQDG